MAQRGRPGLSARRRRNSGRGGGAASRLATWPCPREARCVRLRRGRGRGRHHSADEEAARVRPLPYASARRFARPGKGPNRSSDRDTSHAERPSDCEPGDHEKRRREEVPRRTCRRTRLGQGKEAEGLTAGGKARAQKARGSELHDDLVAGADRGLAGSRIRPHSAHGASRTRRSTGACTCACQPPTSWEWRTEGRGCQVSDRHGRLTPSVA